MSELTIYDVADATLKDFTIALLRDLDNLKRAESNGTIRRGHNDAIRKVIALRDKFEKELNKDRNALKTQKKEANGR